MKNLFTPWKVIPVSESQSRLAVVRDSQGYGVTELFTRSTEAEQNEVANLIAAAPEMLEALETMLKRFDDLAETNQDQDLIDTVLKLINKAKGF